MKKLLIYLVLLTSTAAYSQRELSRQAINEMVNKASGFLGLEGNTQVKIALDKYLATYSRVGKAAALETFRKDINNRKDLLLFMDRALANPESLRQMLVVVNATPKTAGEVIEYFFPKNAAQKPSAQPPTTVTPPVASKAPEPLKPVPASKKFFEGRKTFCDSAGTSHYIMVIIQGNVLLTKYPGKPKDQMNMPIAKNKAVINGEDILSSETHVINFRYENNMLYEKADELGTWVKYLECNE